MIYKERSRHFMASLSVCVSFAFTIVGCQGDTSYQEKTGKTSSTSSTSVHTPPQSPATTSPSPPASPPPISSKPAPSSPPAPTSTKSPGWTSPPSPSNVQLPAEYYEWKKDEFRPQNEYINRCVFPTLPTHKKGTMLDELFAWRDLIFKYYEFSGDVVDIDPRKYVLPNSATFQQHYDSMTNSNSYIQKLRSFVTDENGELIHGLYPTKTVAVLEEERKARKPKYTFGIEWEVFSEGIPRDYRVRYTEPGAPASELAHKSSKVERGDQLIKVNDFDFLNGTISSNITSANELLIPKNRSDTTTFVFRNPSTNEERTVLLKGVLASASIYDRDIQYTSVLETENGNVGYLHLGKYGVNVRKYHSEIEKFKKEKISDIIVDLRYFDEIEDNSVDSQNEASFAYMIVGSGKTQHFPGERKWYGLTNFKKYRYILRKPNPNIAILRRPSLWYINSGHSHPYDFADENYPEEYYMFKQVDFNSWCPAWRREGTKSGWEGCVRAELVRWNDWLWWPWLVYQFPFSFETLNLDKVYIIVSEHSCNRAEFFINALRGIDVDIILIGEDTCGNPYRRTYIKNCGISVEIIAGRYYNEKYFTSYEEGFKPANSKSKTGISIPGCYVEDDLGKPIGDLEEPMLKAALQYRKDKTCP